MDNIFELSIEDILRAYNALSPDEQAYIDDQANILIDHVKGRKFESGYKPAFSWLMALEVLAKTGVWMAQNPDKKG